MVDETSVSYAQNKHIAYNISLRKVIADPASQSHLQLHSLFQITLHYKSINICVYADIISSGC